MANWYTNKWGWAGIILVIILNSVGALAFFPILQAFGALFLVGVFPLLLATLIPLLFAGWFLGIGLGEVYHKFT
jgi:hypothetical protein